MSWGAVGLAPLYTSPKLPLPMRFASAHSPVAAASSASEYCRHTNGRASTAAPTFPPVAPTAAAAAASPAAATVAACAAGASAAEGAAAACHGHLHPPPAPPATATPAAAAAASFPSPAAGVAAMQAVDAVGSVSARSTAAASAPPSLLFLNIHHPLPLSTSTTFASPPSSLSPSLPPPSILCASPSSLLSFSRLTFSLCSLTRM
ncbi:unnamed protein product [Closterium sp. NIES-54]